LARRLHVVVQQRGGGQSDVTVSTITATSGTQLQNDVTVSIVAATCITESQSDINVSTVTGHSALDFRQPHTAVTIL